MSPSQRAEWVISLDLGAFEKSLLFVLAHRANSFSGESWTTVERLSRDTGMSARKVQTATRCLERQGILSVRRTAGHKANIYRLRIRQTQLPEMNESPEPAALMGDPNPAQQVSIPRTQCTLSLHAVHPEQGIEQTIEQATPSASTIWDLARSWNLGGSLTGKLIREHGEEAVAQAVTVTSLKRPADPKSYLLAILKNKRTQEVRRVHSDW